MKHLHSTRAFLLTFALLLCWIGNGPLLAQDANQVRLQVYVTIPAKKSTAKKPAPDEVATALSACRAEILRKYIQQCSAPRQVLITTSAESINRSLDTIVTGVDQVGTPEVDAKAKTLSLAAVGYVNEKSIDLLLPRQSDAKNYISLIFVSRRQTEVKRFGTEVITGNSVLRADTRTDVQQVTGDKTQVAVTTKSDDAVVSKSAEIARTDKILYDVATADALDTAMEGALVERNFRMVPAATLRKRSNGAFAVEKFIEAFKVGNDVDAELIQNAADACSAMKPRLPFYGYGTLTIEKPQRDPASGRTRVNIIVYAKVIDCRDDFATTAGALEAIQYAGLGESATEAETAALTGAAKIAAKMIADKLNAKGVF
jgi:hypothetical protein